MSIRIIGTDQIESDVVSTGKSLKVIPYRVNDKKNAPSKFTYDAAIPAFQPPGNPNDVAVIIGSSSKVVKVTRIRIYTTQNTTGINSWFLLKRITPNVGGTFTVRTDTQRSIFDSPAATAIVLNYTAEPTTLGVSVGFIRTSKLRSPSPSAVSSASENSVIWDTDDLQSHPIVLRGPYESLCINFNGAARPAGLSFQGSITWTEE